MSDVGQIDNQLSNLGGSGWSNNSSNELTSRPGVTYTYDSNGNMLTSVSGTNTTHYTWDFENRLTSVQLPGSRVPHVRPGRANVGFLRSAPNFR